MGIGRPSPHEGEPGSEDDRAARDGVPSVAELLVHVVELLAQARGGSRDFFRTDELARQLGVTPRAVRQMMDRGELPWATLGRQRVVPRAELLAMLGDQARKNEPRRWPT